MAASSRAPSGVERTGLPGHRDQRPHLVVARRLHLVGQRGDGDLAPDLREVPHPTGPATGGEAPAAPFGAAAAGVRGEGEHGPTRPIEVAGDQVEGVDGPGRQRPERHGVGADAAVRDGGGGGGELPGEAADVVGGEAGDGGHGLGGEGGDGFGQVLQAVAVLARRAGVGQAVGQHDLDHGQQQVGVGAGSDGHVLVGLLRGAGAPGIDDDDPPAPGLDGLDPAREVGRRAQAPVGLPGVGPEHQQVVGAVEVGHRHGPGVAEEEAGGHVLGHLVDGAGRAQVAGAHRLDERPQVEGAAHVVDRRVAEVQGHGVAAVGVPDPAQAHLDGGEGLVPGDRTPAVAVLHQRRPEPVRVLVELLERRALGADEPMAEHIVPVAPDPLDRVPLQRDLQPAGRLAERAGPVRDSLVPRVGHGLSLAPRGDRCPYVPGKSGHNVPGWTTQSGGRATWS